MSKEKRPVRKKKKRQGAAILCRLFGTLILLLVIAAAAAVTVPRYMGYEMYHVVSGSMEPAIPVGSIVYVKPVLPQDVADDTIIAFNHNDTVIVHRVVRNKIVEGKFSTKGDANDAEDLNDIKYEEFIGIVVYHLPVLGQFLMIMATGVGKVYVICFAACGALLNIVAGRLEP